MKISKYETRFDKNGDACLCETPINYKVDGRKKYNSPTLLDEFFRDALELHTYTDERVFVVCMDNGCHIIGCFEASHGSATISLFPIREILQKSLMLGAVFIAVAHNHPSGDPTPSEEDITVTNKLRKACGIVDITFVDHIVVSKYGYYSFMEHND